MDKFKKASQYKFTPLTYRHMSIEIGNLLKKHNGALCRKTLVALQHYEKNLVVRTAIHHLASSLPFTNRKTTER